MDKSSREKLDGEKSDTLNLCKEIDRRLDSLNESVDSLSKWRMDALQEECVPFNFMTKLTIVAAMLSRCKSQLRVPVANLLRQVQSLLSDDSQPLKLELELRGKMDPSVNIDRMKKRIAQLEGEMEQMGRFKKDIAVFKWGRMVGTLLSDAKASRMHKEKRHLRKFIAQLQRHLYELRLDLKSRGIAVEDEDGDMVEGKQQSQEEIEAWARRERRLLARAAALVNRERVAKREEQKIKNRVHELQVQRRVQLDELKAYKQQFDTAFAKREKALAAKALSLQDKEAELDAAIHASKVGKVPTPPKTPPMEEELQNWCADEEKNKEQDDDLADDEHEHDSGSDSEEKEDSMGLVQVAPPPGSVVDPNTLVAEAVPAPDWASEAISQTHKAEEWVTKPKAPPPEPPPPEKGSMFVKLADVHAHWAMAGKPEQADAATQAEMPAEQTEAGAGSSETPKKKPRDPNYFYSDSEDENIKRDSINAVEYIDRKRDLDKRKETALQQQGVLEEASDEVEKRARELRQSVVASRATVEMRRAEREERIRAMEEDFLVQRFRELEQKMEEVKNEGLQIAVIKQDLKIMRGNIEAEAEQLDTVRARLNAREDAIDEKELEVETAAKAVSARETELTRMNKQLEKKTEQFNRDMQEKKTELAETERKTNAKLKELNEHLSLEEKRDALISLDKKVRAKETEVLERAEILDSREAAFRDERARFQDLVDSKAKEITGDVNQLVETRTRDALRKYDNLLIKTEKKQSELAEREKALQVAERPLMEYKEMVEQRKEAQSRIRKADAQIVKAQAWEQKLAEKEKELGAIEDSVKSEMGVDDLRRVYLTLQRKYKEQIQHVKGKAFSREELEAQVVMKHDQVGQELSDREAQIRMREEAVDLLEAQLKEQTHDVELRVAQLDEIQKGEVGRALLDERSKLEHRGIALAEREQQVKREESAFAKMLPKLGAVKSAIEKQFKKLSTESNTFDAEALVAKLEGIARAEISQTESAGADLSTREKEVAAREREVERMKADIQHSILVHRQFEARNKALTKREELVAARAQQVNERAKGLKALEKKAVDARSKALVAMERSNRDKMKEVAVQSRKLDTLATEVKEADEALRRLLDGFKAIAMVDLPQVLAGSPPSSSLSQRAAIGGIEPPALSLSRSMSPTASRGDGRSPSPLHASREGITIHTLPSVGDSLQIQPMSISSQDPFADIPTPEFSRPSTVNTVAQPPGTPTSLIRPPSQLARDIDAAGVTAVTPSRLSSQGGPSLMSPLADASKLAGSMMDDMNELEEWLWRSLHVKQLEILAKLYSHNLKAVQAAIRNRRKEVWSNAESPKVAKKLMDKFQQDSEEKLEQWERKRFVQLAREMANQVGDPMLAPVRNVPLPFESSQSLGFSEPLPKNARKKVLGAALMPRSRLLDSPQRGTPSPKPSPKTELKDIMGDSQKPSTPLDRARAVSKIDLFKTIRDK